MAVHAAAQIDHGEKTGAPHHERGMLGRGSRRRPARDGLACVLLSDGPRNTESTMADTPGMSLQAFEQHLARAGLKVTPEKARELYAHAPAVMALAARVHRDFAYADEPAHVFAADRGAT